MFWADIMTQITVALFLDYLHRSRLVDEVRLGAVVAEMRAELGPEKSEQIDTVTRWCVSRKLVTEWQAKQLLRKRYKGFFLRQYKILSHIGAGGMSTVYLAEHSIMQRRVAIKVLPKKKLEKSVYLDRFIREAQTIASLDHPNIVRAYDIDQEDDVHYIVMEYFDGRNLQEVIAEKGVLSFETAVDYVRQAALALEYAHQAGVVHRDVKPGNVLVNDQGLVKVLDLGLALLDERNFDGQLTAIQEDKILGTADYLAPEQGIDSHTVDGRADIYGLGGVLYFCLTGHPPFPTGTIAQRLLAHQHEEPQSIFVDRPEAPDSLVRLCRKMMAKKKENRQQSALEVVSDMQNWLIENGFADESDFPPLETLRPTARTLGAVPIPSQEQRLRELDEAQWFAKQQEEHRKNQQYQQHSGDLYQGDGHSDAIGGHADKYAPGEAFGRFDSDPQQETDSSTVSGMMRPASKSRRHGSGISDNTQFGSASSTNANGLGNVIDAGGSKDGSLSGASGMGSSGDSASSASRIRLLSDGQSSAMMPNPNAKQQHRGIIDDEEEDDLHLGAKPSAAKENDPVLFALTEMRLSEQHKKTVASAQVKSKSPSQPKAKSQISPQTTAQRTPAQQQASRETPHDAATNRNSSLNVSSVAMAIAPPQNAPSQQQTAARVVLQALTAESHGGELGNDDGAAAQDIANDYGASHGKPSTWHRHVPVWFWCLFGGFVISTIFLAGILVAIIFRM